MLSHVLKYIIHLYKCDKVCAHTSFCKKEFWCKNFSVVGYVCRLGAHTLFHFMRGSYMVLYHNKVSASYIKRKYKNMGLKLVKLFFALEMPGKYFCSIRCRIFRKFDKLSHNFCSNSKFLTRPECKV